MRKLLPALALVFLLTGCGGTTATPPPADSGTPTRVTPPELVIPDSQPRPESSSDTEENPDRILSSLTASVSDGRVLRLDAIGMFLPDRGNHCGIREVQVYEDGVLVQTVSAAAAPLSDSGSGYTESAAVDGAMAVRDMNFDGLDDLELSDWSSFGTNPHHFWLWDAAAGQYIYAFTLQGANANPETREVTASYNESGKDYLDTYQYNSGPGLYGLVFLHRRTEDWKNGTEDFPLVDYYEMQGGEIVLLREEFTNYNDDGIAMREVREFVNGELIPVRIERLEVVDGELRVVETTPVEPPAPENPDLDPGEEPYPWEEYLDPAEGADQGPAEIGQDELYQEPEEPPAEAAPEG